MKYVGIQTQIWRNNRNTVLLLLLFPIILLGMVLGTIMVLDWLGFFCWDGVCGPGLQATTFHWDVIWPYFLDAMPYTLGVTAIWFIIAYFANTAIIRHATHARPLERKENVRVYNIVENLNDNAHDGNYRRAGRYGTFCSGGSRTHAYQEP